MYLWKNLQNIPGLSIWGPALDQDKDQVPFGFQVVVEDREGFYKFLALHGVIGEIQWLLPVQYYTPSSYAAYLGEHSLMLQCDQRYGEKEMAYTVQVIRQYFEKEQI